jgi:choline dehydrogenase-like flavoprotein
LTSSGDDVVGEALVVSRLVQPDVLVVGGGIIGTTTAAYLVRRGASVTLVERAETGLGRGSPPQQAELIGYRENDEPSLLVARQGKARFSGRPGARPISLTGFATAPSAIPRVT